MNVWVAMFGAGSAGFLAGSLYATITVNKIRDKRERMRRQS